MQVLPLRRLSHALSAMNPQRAWGWILGLLLLASCGTTRDKSEELARVAKDWCLTIRASQILPVYPLTEDLQPGDVFLVSTRLEDQIAICEDKGFLPLDNLVARLYPQGYANFYREGYGVGEEIQLPLHWQAALDDAPHGWEFAPRAAFPSYTFEVRRNSGLNLAIPIQGVPVGLSFLDAGLATGTVQISEAYTYGVDTGSLQEEIRDWADSKRDFLRQFATGDEQTEEGVHYLRVVNRVYLTGRVNVSLLNEEASGAQLDAGAPKDVSLQQLAIGNTQEHLTAINDALGKSLDQVPGGSVKLVSASGRGRVAQRDLSAPARDRLSRLRPADPGWRSARFALADPSVVGGRGGLGGQRVGPRREHRSDSFLVGGRLRSPRGAAGLRRRTRGGRVDQRTEERRIPRIAP